KAHSFPTRRSSDLPEPGGGLPLLRDPQRALAKAARDVAGHAPTSAGVERLRPAAVGTRAFDRHGDLLRAHPLEEGVRPVYRERWHQQEMRDGDEDAADRG